MEMETDMRTGNIKNAPEGRYFTEYGYSQAYPWVVIGVSPSGKTITLQRVDTKGDPDWKPQFYIGGFAGHCHNQSEQTWLYAGLEERTTTIRKNKRGEWRRKGVLFREEAAGPYYFYDYNF